MFFFGVPSKRAFGKKLMKAMHARTGGQYRFEVEQFEILRLDSESRAFLGNVYAEHCALPKSERAAHIERLSMTLDCSVHQIPDDYEVARAHLRPKVWPRAMIDNVGLRHRVEGKEPMDMPHSPLGEHLYLALVYDSEYGMQSLSQERLDIWGVSFYEALEVALQNLSESTLGYSKIGDSVMCSITGDNYDSSRLMLVEIIRQQNFVGTPIAFVPDRDSLFVADSADPNAVEIVFQLAGKASEEAQRLLCSLPLVLHDEEWVDWEPPEDHKVRPIYRRNHLNFFGGLYAEQQELLNQLYATDSRAPFVASFTAIEKSDTKELLSYCVWSNGFDSILPKTDLIMFLDGEDMIASLRWHDAIEVVDDLLVVDHSYYPARYRTNGFPSKKQLTSMPQFK